MLTLPVAVFQHTASLALPVTVRLLRSLTVVLRTSVHSWKSVTVTE